MNLTELNNNHFIEEVKSVVNSFVVMLNLLYDSEFTMDVYENRVYRLHDYEHTITVGEVNADTYVMRLFTYKDQTMSLTLDKDRFRTLNQRKLKGMTVHTEFGLANLNKAYWKIRHIDTIDDLNRVIQYIDELMSK